MTWLGGEAFPLVYVASVLWNQVTTWYWLHGSVALESGLSTSLSLPSGKNNGSDWSYAHLVTLSVFLLLLQPHFHLTFARIFKSWRVLRPDTTHGEAELSFGNQKGEGLGEWDAWWRLRAEAPSFGLLSVHVNEIVLWVFVPHLFKDILWQVEWVRCLV